MPASYRIALLLGSLVPLLPVAAARAADKPLPEESAWNTAHQKPPMTADEARGFMRRLAEFVVAKHMKSAADSPQRGMIYEYRRMDENPPGGTFIQGEALDTMHDGAWFAAAMVNAWRATGDEYYLNVLTEYQLPFYCKMLNQSDELFTTKRNDARPGATPWDREHGLQEGEKGFVPYFWDDGGSVSLERQRDKNPLAIRPSVDFLAGQPNPNFLLDGYSQGSSNHLAQDLGVMLVLSWLALQDAKSPQLDGLRGEVAKAAKNLHECRMRHHGHIPMCDAPAALAAGDKQLIRHVPDGADTRLARPDNHFTRAFWDYQPGQRYNAPGFADNEQYLYYAALARNLVEKRDPTPPKPLAFKLIFDAYSERLFFERYYDDAPRPPGINVFDLYPLYAKDGKLEHYRSDRKGPFNRPVPAGSRMGPQNMVVCGWALQLLKKYPGIWQEGPFKEPLPDPTEELERELAGGLRTWEAIFDSYGYIPTSLGRGEPWDHYSDSGGYAHLISAASQYILYLEGKRDWELHGR